MRGRIREPRPAPPAFLFVGAIVAEDFPLTCVKEALVERLGPLEEGGESPVYPFPDTDTYRDAMGPRLRRRFYVFSALRPQNALAEVKRETMALEAALAHSEAARVPRPVNLDPGIVNDCRVILATTKDHAHRLYRGWGIYEEVTLIYRGGRYEALPWTYPDYRSGVYHPFFEAVRSRLLARWRREGWRPAPGR